MILKWSEQGWEDYLYWQQTDKKIIKRINKLIEDIKRDPFDGLGNPEPLKYNWSGFWSRRIDQEHRLVYAVENNEILIAQCRYHY
ncbi:putative addiction module toxin, Txe/YoeB [Crocosphaera subtropica ATCC 51142]|uniref:Toxin YoeB n=1 Tax=Crocosphaera subtropica (strain ATCC 51142 / BH68) TaxID=43989 RepID=B1WSN0_CROS5|nr:Txe/YoeB family addiction module toxin [Crocosphaera subtropica]ACB53609.1 putative addiction module toxin, Txe/YoeB [Crocosphaera subtropica ATCC 51142]